MKVFFEKLISKNKRILLELLALDEISLSTVCKLVFIDKFTDSIQIIYWMKKSETLQEVQYHKFKMMDREEYEVDEEFKFTHVNTIKLYAKHLSFEEEFDLLR